MMMNGRKIGVCLDYGIAYLLEEKRNENIITIIEANEDELKHAYFRKLFEFIKDFDTVTLFGQAQAKNELIHRIKNDKLSNIEIENHLAEDKVTENQKVDFINDYFNA